MLSVVKVLGGMLVLGRIATSDVAALQAHAKVDPRVAGLDAVFTDVLVSFCELYLVEMIASGGHIDTPHLA